MNRVPTPGLDNRDGAYSHLTPESEKKAVVMLPDWEAAENSSDKMVTKGA
jgi:hypothetical protein